MNRSSDPKASALRWAAYIAEQEAKHPEAPGVRGKPFGVSEALGKAAQKRAAPVLAAQDPRTSRMPKEPADAL